MANGSEGALDRVCGSDVLSVLSREVVEGQEDITVFCQPSNGLVVFHAVGSRVSIHARLCLPNVVQMALCFGLTDFGIAFSTLPVLWNQQRCSFVVP